MSDRVIHVVDDDPDLRESLGALLQAHGFNFIPYADGRDFLDRLECFPGGCALVDVNMPNVDGMAVLKELSRRGVSLPVIVMTGAADVPLAVKAMKAGAIDFVEKPLSSETLLAAIVPAVLGPRAEEDGGMAAFRTRLAELTEREREVLEGVVAGHPTKVIAFTLGISPRTVDVHRLHLNEKLRVSGVPNLIRLAIRAGVVPGELWAGPSR